MEEFEVRQVVDWSKYRLVVEPVPPEDGGGYRAFYPTLGYAPLGCGDTVEEALASLEDGQGAVLDFIAVHGGSLIAGEISEIEDSGEKVRFIRSARGESHEPAGGMNPRTLNRQMNPGRRCKRRPTSLPSRSFPTCL